MNARKTRHFSPRRSCHVAIALSLVALCAVSPGRAHAGGLTITPTFDSSITSDPNAAAIEGAINAAIGVVQTGISNPINVTIYFQEMPNPGVPQLGESETGQGEPSYYEYYNLLKAVDTAPGASSAQQTAFASLGAAPSGPSSGNPVNGYANVLVNGPNLRALGYIVPPVIEASNGQVYDSVISLNTSRTYPPNANNGSNYGLQAVAAHEIDESLGIGGGGSNLGVESAFNGPGGVPGPVGPLDLYRYSAPGVRSFSIVETTSPYAYFSINGGNTVLSYFNQTSTLDYADWLSNPRPAGYGPQVQDAFESPGTNAALGVNELTALNVIGYNLVPEPSSFALLAAGIAGLGFATWRKKYRRA